MQLNAGGGTNIAQLNLLEYPVTYNKHILDNDVHWTVAREINLESACLGIDYRRIPYENRLYLRLSDTISSLLGIINAVYIVNEFLSILLMNSYVIFLIICHLLNYSWTNRSNKYNSHYKSKYLRKLVKNRFYKI